ncbi:murein transglycosylase A [Nitratireductor sp. GCM10026969]|uniref:murein transglycosylase A n=1 Tax=Nitratireductor sp. GCM10026969 TaxID=3252645 RepID=UPI003614ACF9
MSLSTLFRPISYSDLPGWSTDTVSAAFPAFRRCAFQASRRPYRTGRLGVRAEAFTEAFADARAMADAVAEETARRFFERHFVPFRIEAEQGAAGFVTGYYEPEVEASPVGDGRFTVPLYRRPDDLVDVDGQDLPCDLDPSFAFARCAGGRLVAYHDRQAIDRGALAGRGLELCWLADRVDAFFIHMQGAARLSMTDGTTRRITYAAKSGHPFTGIGGVLAELGEIPRERVTMQTIRAWLARNPHRVDEILWHNRSYIFFRETPAGEPDLGPVAAAKVQLEAGRSLAVDRMLHTFATPFFVDAPDLSVDGRPYRRLMIAQDTGSAITRPARGDVFMGTGGAAGSVAGVIRHKAAFHALLPRALMREGRGQ